MTWKQFPLQFVYPHCLFGFYKDSKFCFSAWRRQCLKSKAKHFEKSVLFQNIELEKEMEPFWQTFERSKTNKKRRLGWFINQRTLTLQLEVSLKRLIQNCSNPMPMATVFPQRNAVICHSLQWNPQLVWMALQTVSNLTGLDSTEQGNLMLFCT